jgi:hypothetical protein
MGNASGHIGFEQSGGLRCGDEGKESMAWGGAVTI